MALGHSFNLGQRVNIPGIKNIQGLVSLPNGTNEFHAPKSGGDRHWYFLRWLSADGEKKCDWFGEADLIAAQEATPPITITFVDEADYQPAAIITSAAKAKAKKVATKKKR